MADAKRPFSAKPLLHSHAMIKTSNMPADCNFILTRNIKQMKSHDLVPKLGDETP